MKKLFTLIFLSVISTLIFAQPPKTDEELKNYLVENGFDCFTFNADGTYSYNQRVIGDSVFGKGTYSIKDGIINFETLTDNEYTPQYGKWFSELMDLPGKYRLDFNAVTIYSQGALVNINKPEMKLWSGKAPEAYSKINYHGVECIRYPWVHDSEKGTECEYIVLLDNLKLRAKPSTSAPLVTVDGIDEDCGYAYGPRSIELAGNICVIRAKTVENSTIDNITAPWYLIIAYGNDGMGMDTKEAWIFGGYVKEVKKSQVKETAQEYRSMLEQSILRIGGHLKSDE